MSCATWIALACIAEFIVLGFYHLDVVGKKDGRIADLEERLKGKPDFAEDRVQRL